MKIAGRLQEISVLQSLLQKDGSEFLAVYGRRRIGKTYLVRQVYSANLIFECSGLHQKEFSQQLENFWLTLTEVDKKPKPMPKTWLQAFAQLKTYLNELGPKKKVVFLDEISWFETPRSGFLAALDNFWNQYCSKRSDIILVICGSAASWIINKVINDRGGLHNRITKHIQLMPFTLAETRDFLTMQRVKLTPKDIAQLYMCVGGIPFYLKDVQPGQSIPQILDALFFESQALLRNEFSNLYAALFKNSRAHELIVKALATKNKGLTRNEIVEATSLKSGGGLSVLLNELIQCGFVKQIFPIKKSKDDALFRLVDEYTLYYFKFLQNNKTNTSWLYLSNKQAYKVWSGFAFENLCFKHVAQIKKALGISGIISNEYSWTLKGEAQIDLLVDRDDNCINLLELKYYDGLYEMTKGYAAQLQEKVRVFKQNTRTKKNVFVTLLTVFGAKRNEHYLSSITNELTIDDLFQ
ncbi:AAA family ATPase [Spirosoma sp. HMF3257]|uniref:ATP-binding protein n=1 Tax=Spirosoma telluris TaxID=2183553 RepID=A0A327NE96_9BACT|nr:AAA family ATPase [Spirosoma telluris]RAI73437.1 ATP-binding protein [Spirosoma telluris]